MVAPGAERGAGPGPGAAGGGAMAKRPRKKKAARKNNPTHGRRPLRGR